MISTFIAENLLLTRVALLVVLALAVLVAVLLVRRERGGRRISGVIAVVSGILVLGLTLSPDVRAVQSEAVCNVSPQPWPLDLQNVALFVPLALFSVVALRRVAVVALALPVLSALIELVQFLSPGLGRRCDVDDLLANVIGGLIGVALGMLALRLGRRRG